MCHPRAILIYLQSQDKAASIAELFPCSTYISTHGSSGRLYTGEHDFEAELRAFFETDKKFWFLFKRKMSILVLTNQTQLFSGIQFPEFFQVTVEAHSGSHGERENKGKGEADGTDAIARSAWDLLILHYLNPGIVEPVPCLYLQYEDPTLIQSWIHSFRPKWKPAHEVTRSSAAQLFFWLPDPLVPDPALNYADYAYHRKDGCRVGASLGSMPLRLFLLDLCYKLGFTSKYGA